MGKKIIIAGSRNFNNYQIFCKILEKYLLKLDNNKEITILSGHCRGTDLMAEKYANEKNIPLKIFPARWSKYGKAAGPKRNEEMVRDADLTIAFLSEGNGTKSLISLAKKKGIPVEIIYIENL